MRTCASLSRRADGNLSCFVIKSTLRQYIMVVQIEQFTDPISPSILCFVVLAQGMEVGETWRVGRQSNFSWKALCCDKIVRLLVVSDALMSGLAQFSTASDSFVFPFFSTVASSKLFEPAECGYPQCWNIKPTFNISSDCETCVLKTGLPSFEYSVRVHSRSLLILLPPPVSYCTDKQHSWNGNDTYL